MWGRVDLGHVAAPVFGLMSVWVLSPCVIVTHVPGLCAMEETKPEEAYTGLQVPAEAVRCSLWVLWALSHLGAVSASLQAQD